jgi:hypothetical protein
MLPEDAALLQSIPRNAATDHYFLKLQHAKTAAPLSAESDAAKQTLTLRLDQRC